MTDVLKFDNLMPAVGLGCVKTLAWDRPGGPAVDVGRDTGFSGFFRRSALDALGAAPWAF